ncbi:MAG: hypothetical protein JW827_03490, partial [Spirochaetes bacterium]|nr:hypothetical protein [Spirochaetota bacterium]
MKKYTFFITLLIMSFMLTSAYGALSDSLRYQNSLGLFDDDLEFIQKPSYFGDLKGQAIVFGMDAINFGSGLYTGIGLDAFGLQERIAVKYTEGSASTLTDVEESS